MKNNRRVSKRIGDRLYCYTNNNIDFCITIRKFKNTWSDEIREEYNAFSSKYLKLGACNEVFSHILNLMRLDLFTDVSINNKFKISSYNPFSIELLSEVRFDSSGIKLSQDYLAAYFSELIAYDDIESAYNSIFSDSVRDSYLFSIRLDSTIFKYIVNINGIDFIIRVGVEGMLIDLYHSKESAIKQGESLLTIPRDMLIKVTKAKMSGKMVYMIGLVGDIPKLKYE